MIFSGVLRRRRMGLMEKKLIMVMETPMIPPRRADMVTDLRRPSLSSAPKRWEIKIEKPWEKPEDTP